MFRVGGQKVPTKTVLLIASDALLIILSLILSAAARFHNEPGMLRVYLLSPLAFPRFALIALVCTLALYYSDLYNSHVLRHRSELFVRLFQAMGTACLGLTIVYYFAPDLSPGRGIAVLAVFAIPAFVLGWRLLLEATGLLNSGAERLLILGTGEAGVTLVREIVKRPELNLQVVGFLDETRENIGKPLVNPGIIGAVSDVETLAMHHEADRVILSLAERRGCTPVRQLLQLKFAGIGVEDAHSMYESISGRILLEHLSPSWLILSEGFRKSRWLLGVKRGVDVIVSLLLLLLAWPILMLVALAIWLETGRPVLFRQERTGLKGTTFEILKFRSMYQNAEQNGPSWTADGDHRITRVGRFIRKFRSDEFPQLINVLKGRMSLVGPRPERPYFCRLLEDQIPFFALRHSVRPGITGWAQIKFPYGASVEQAKAKLEFDLFYVKHLSVTLDLAILFETAKVILHGRGAK